MNQSSTISLRENLSAIVKKHEPKVLVIGGRDVSKAAAAISRMTTAFGFLGLSFSEFAQSSSFRDSKIEPEDWKFSTEISKSKMEELIESFNNVRLEQHQIPTVLNDTSPKSFGMKKMGINNNKNFKRKR